MVGMMGWVFLPFFPLYVRFFLSFGFFRSVSSLSNTVHMHLYLSVCLPTLYVPLLRPSTLFWPGLSSPLSFASFSIIASQHQLILDSG